MAADRRIQRVPELVFGRIRIRVDLLGWGEKFDLKLEHGERSKIYEAGLYKPYLFNRLLSVHFTLFYQNVLYPDLFTRKAKGMCSDIHTRIKGYWWGSLDYRFEAVDAAPSMKEGRENSEGHDLGTATLRVYTDAVDDPLFPTGGARCLLSFEYAGSALGSDVQYIKPEFEGALFLPAVWDHIMGLHLAWRSIRAIANLEIPYWERFYLGGERTIRGYDVYSIGPRDQDGRNRGGEKSIVLNAEYIIPVFDQLAAVLFIDGGNAVRWTQNFALDDLFWSTGLEIRVKISRFQIPLRLIFAYNNRVLSDGGFHYAFRLAFGASF
jgi:outer membrane protein insertion porin family